MPFRAAINQNYHRLKIESDIIVAHAFAHVAGRCQGHAPHEPDLIAGLVLHGTPGLAAAWGQVLAPYQVSLTGVFCHQSPVVRHHNGGCELGDVMWVHEHTDVKGDTSRNALLLQAKMTDHLLHPVPRNEAFQYELYESWPQFEYRHQPLAPTTRQVTPAQPHAGAQYLLISEPLLQRHLHWRFPAALTCTVADPLQAWHSLGGALAMFLARGTGRAFADQPIALAGDDWDAVVWDLLRTSAHKVFNRRRARYNNEPHQVVSYLASLDGLSLATGSPSRLLRVAFGADDANALGDREPFEGLEDYEGVPPVPPDEREFADGGVSVIIVETRESEAPTG